MRARFGLIAAILCSLFLAPKAMAQAAGPDTQQGLTPYGSFQKGNVDSVNLANGNVALRIPLVSYPQRGGKLKLSFSLFQSNKGWYLNNTGHSANWAYAGGQALVIPDQSMVGKEASFSWTDDFNNKFTIKTLSAITSDGASHELLGGDPRFPWGGHSTDGTGIAGAYGMPVSLTDREGIQYTGGQAPFSFTVPYKPPTSIIDPNGNEITYGTSGWTDTVGRIIPGYPTSGTMLNAPGVASSTTNCPTGTVSAVQWSVPGYGGSSASTFKFCYSNIAFATNFPPQAGVSQASGTALLISAIVLPNLTTWQFTYDSYLDLASITFPTGGTITYAWENTIFGLSGSRAVTSRTVNANDGTGNHTWNYQWLQTVGSALVNIITDPQSNDTVVTPWAGGYIKETQTYSGSHTSGTILKTVTTGFTPLQEDGLCAYSSSDCGTINVLPISTTISWPNGKTSETTTTYDTGFTYTIYDFQGDTNNYTALYGLPTLQTYSDYGSGAPGGLLKQVATSYEWQSNSNYGSLLDLVASSKIEDGSGNDCAETDYTYDTTSRLVSSGVTEQHVSPPLAARGNLSATTRQLASASTPCSASPSWTPITSYENVYDTGMVNQSIDPVGNTTTYTYSSTFYGAYPTASKNALSQTTNYNYDSYSGLLTSIQDPNLQTTSFTYDDMFRLYTATYPDGGLDTITHQETTPPFTATLTTKINSSQNKVNTNVFDGLGRVSKSELTDPQGMIYTATTYDPEGRMYTVSNPYRSTSDQTYGLTTYTYDTLNRTKVVAKPDGSQVKTAYCDNTTLVTDEASHWRRSSVDGLGRLVEVDEPNSTTATVNSNGCPAGGDPIWVTTYAYDNLSNMTGIVQGGSRNRSFVYDTLSRLTTSTNPESGTISYTYDANGNVTTKTDARSIVTNYSPTASPIDALNRVTEITYSDGTPTAIFAYDSSTYTYGTTCLGLTNCYNIGHRTSMSNANSSGGIAAQYEAYDKMGRPLIEREESGSEWLNTSYTYDLAGDLATLTYPSGNTVTYTYDNAGRPSDAIDNTSAINYVTGSCTNGASSPSTGVCYAPQGAVSQMLNGTNLATTYLFNQRLQPCWMYATTSTALATTTLCTAADSTPGNILDMQYCFMTWSSGACQTSTTNNGNVIGIRNNRDTTRSQGFTYDQVNRIVSAETPFTSGSNCWGETYTYDQWANMTAIGYVTGYGTCSQESLSVTATTKNQLSATGFSYDASGNMLTDGANTYTYNAESEISTAAGYTYLYDGDGKRVVRGTGVVYWYGAGSEVLSEAYPATIATDYIYFGGKRIARRRYDEPNVYYYEADMLGSSRTVTVAGATSPFYDADFYPFGGERPITDTAVIFDKFEGKYRDPETGNDDFGARYYNSRIGRWLSADWSSVPVPVPYANLTNPQTLNLYAMVADNPETFADLDGHDEEGAPEGDPDPGAGNAVPVAQNGSCTSGAANCPKPAQQAQQQTQSTQNQQSAQNQSQTQQAQQSPQRGLTVGVGVAGNADVGAVATGAEANGTAVVTASVSSTGKPSVGAAAGGAAVAYAGDHVAAAPKQETTPTVAGAYVGGGVTVVASNAANSTGLKGPFQTISGNVGGGAGASVSLSFDHTGTFVVQITVGPGLGLSGFGVTTNTTTGCAGPGCK